MSTVLGIVLFCVLAFWLGYEITQLVKGIKKRRKDKKEKSDQKTDNSNKDDLVINDDNIK